MTLEPSSAKRMAVALPIPAAPPVTNTTLSFILIEILLKSERNLCDSRMVFLAFSSYVRVTDHHRWYRDAAKHHSREVLASA
jgi:hypothetical protein